MALDMIESRLKTAVDNGASLGLNPTIPELPEKAMELTNGHGMDVGIIAFGGNVTVAAETIRDIMKITPAGHRMGNLVMVGLAELNTTFPADWGNMNIMSSSRPGPGYHDKNWEIGQEYPSALVEWTTQRNMEECLRFVEEGTLNLTSLISGEFTFDTVIDGVESIIANPSDSMGVILNPNA